MCQKNMDTFFWTLVESSSIEPEQNKWSKLVCISCNLKQPWDNQCIVPPDTRRNNNVINKASRRRLDVIITLYVRHVSIGIYHFQWLRVILTNIKMLRCIHMQMLREFHWRYMLFWQLQYSRLNWIKNGGNRLYQGLRSIWPFRIS